VQPRKIAAIVSAVAADAPAVARSVPEMSADAMQAY
jgi:hypothetical protein